MNKSITIFGLALITSTTLCCCLARDVSQMLPQPQQPLVQSQSQQRHSLASKLIPKARTARSLSDMFEKMKSKIFGSKKGQSSASSAVSSQSQQAMQSLASVNSAQRQPWADLNSFNQQYNPYSPLSSSNYQWPAGASGPSQQPFSGQSSLNSGGFMNSPSLPNGYPSLTGAQSSSMPGLDGGANQMPGASGPSGGQGGLLSSASHLIAQYLSPGSSSPSSSSSASSSPLGQQNAQQQNNNILSPQQQSQYNEFASILDSMVAQTGVGSAQSAQQRQPNMNNQFSGQGQPNYQQNGVMGPVVGSNSPNGDQDMSGSSNVQSYMPATQQQASQKSSMVSLAEQLAPGAQFNKLVSFPFSLSNNDDPNKEGRYKLHIPFLNQHVKRSDQPQVAANNYAQAQQRVQQQQQQLYQQQAQQYLNSNQNIYNQQYLAAQQSQQQQPGMMAQASQLSPSIVSPQSVQVASPQQVAAASSSSPSSSSSSSSSSQPSSSASIVPSSSSSSASASVPSASSAISSVSASQNQSPSSSIMSQQSPQSSISVSSSVSSSSINSRPNWSVADTSSKLIPIQTGSQTSQAETNPQN